VKFRGKTIADVLAMNVDAALELFASVPKIRKIMQTLHDVGLGYLPLGQSAPRFPEEKPSASSSPPSSPAPTPARRSTSSTSRPRVAP